MKKIITIAAIICAPFLLNAQDSMRLPDGRYISRELLNIPAVLLVVYLLSTFILNILKWILDYRLKSKLVDKGVSETVVGQFLRPAKSDARTQSIKSALVLFGLAAGLIIVNYTLPLGIHSIAIMAFCLAAAFLGYFYYLRQSGK
jgi:hypothetical protein